MLYQNLNSAVANEQSQSDGAPPQLSNITENLTVDDQGNDDVDDEGHIILPVVSNAWSNSTPCSPTSALYLSSMPHLGDHIEVFWP